MIHEFLNRSLGILVCRLTLKSFAKHAESLIETMYDLRWHRTTGIYVVKKLRCRNCGNQQTAPQNPNIQYVTYNAVMVGITRLSKPYFRPHLQGSNFDPFQLLKPHDAETQNLPTLLLFLP